MFQTCKQKRDEFDLIGTVIGEHYQIEAKIGQGGIASVYRAVHLRLGGNVAVKVLFPQWQSDEQICQRFLQEAQFQNQINHPNIVRVNDFIEEQGFIGFIAEWCSDGDLGAWLDKRGPLMDFLGEVRSLLFPLLGALQFSHQQGIIHRDLKPQNILIDRCADKVIPKLTDFGFAKKLSNPSITSTGLVLGTLHYMSPEQIAHNKHVNHLSDIYSFGVLLYHILAGYLPFQGDQSTIIDLILHQKPAKPHGMSRRLWQIISCCMAKDPRHRFANCRELGAALERCLTPAQPIILSFTKSPQIATSDNADDNDDTKDIGSAERGGQNFSPRVCDDLFASCTDLADSISHTSQQKIPSDGVLSSQALVSFIFTGFRKQVLLSLAILIFFGVGIMGGVWWLYPPNTSGCGDRRVGDRHIYTVSGVNIATRFISAGSFYIGSPISEQNIMIRDCIRAGVSKHQCYDWIHAEAPLKKVTLTHNYLIMETEITQKHYQAVMGYNPSFFKACGLDCPVEMVSWHEVSAYANALSRKQNLEQCYVCRGIGAGLSCELNPKFAVGNLQNYHRCLGWRLPTEAEWEYAARSGTQTALYTGDIDLKGFSHSRALDPIAWYTGNSGVDYLNGYDCSGWREAQYQASKCGTHLVGKKTVNAWGLRDMLGNVLEWCWDVYQYSYLNLPAQDPLGPGEGIERSLRGGSWFHDARYVRVAQRFKRLSTYRSNYIGFRLVITLP